MQSRARVLVLFSFAAVFMAQATLLAGRSTAQASGKGSQAVPTLHTSTQLVVVDVVVNTTLRQACAWVEGRGLYVDRERGRTEAPLV